MINFPLLWHPKFRQREVGELGRLFLGENDEFFIDKLEYQKLNSVIQQQGMLSDYALQSPNTLTQVKRINHVRSLMGDDILVRPGDPARQYIAPDFSLEPEETSLTSGVAVYWFSATLKQSAAAEQIMDAIKQCDLVDTAVAIVDDYLDPRLTYLHTHLKQLGRDWLLVKLVGENMMVGPFFSQDRSLAACYQCLQVRLKQNNPVREWYRRYSGSEQYLPVPTFYDLDRVRQAVQQVPVVISRLIDHPLAQLYLGAEASQGSFHALTKRPQCQSCGDPGKFGEMNRPPFELDSVIKGEDDDGGFRTASRQQTLDDIKHLVDPIVGVISDLKKISNGHDNQKMSIYRAAYFQNSFDTERLSADTFVQLSLGKGVSDKQAQASALGETLERQAAQYTGEEEIVLGLADSLPNRAYLPHQLNPFSDQQYHQFEQYQCVSLSRPQWVKKHDCDTPLHWVAGWSFTRQEIVYFPAAHCFANTPFEDHIHSLYTHNGNAAGNTKEEAILQGAFELIERDAVAIWWYNQTPRPEIDMAIIPPEQRKIIAATLDSEWDYWLLDISNDIEVVCCVAVGRHKFNDNFVLGFGAHFNPAIACGRALTEMYQLITIKDEVTGPFDFSQIGVHPFLLPKRNSGKKTQHDFPNRVTVDIKDSILQLAGLLQHRDLELCVVAYSRPDIALKTVKVIVPGLCHIWPQLANRRLYSVPVTMGWLSKPLTESLVNPMSLYL